MLPLENLLVADHLELRYPGGLFALADIDTRIPAGQFVSIIGPSGCGKSTFLRLIAGLLQPTAGAITIAGESPVQARRQTTPISFVFQDATLLPWRSVLANVQLPLELLRVPKSEIVGKANAAIELVGLADFASKFPNELSGGMRMRVSLARALATQPKLLLLDEPFGALDDITRGQLNDELLRLWLSSGWTSVFVTHNIAEAVFLSERVIVVGPRPGRIVADVPISISQPRTAQLRATAEFARLTGQIGDQLRRACA